MPVFHVEVLVAMERQNHGCSVQPHMAGTTCARGLLRVCVSFSRRRTSGFSACALCIQSAF